MCRFILVFILATMALTCPAHAQVYIGTLEPGQSAAVTEIGMAPLDTLSFTGFAIDLDTLTRSGIKEIEIYADEKTARIPIDKFRDLVTGYPESKPRE